MPANCGLLVRDRETSEDSNLQPDRYERMVYYAFDLLHFDGFDTRAAPLVERKRLD
jgi:ATP-dependent DNA ligase